MEFFVENINLVIFIPLIMCCIIGFNGLVSNKIDKTTLFSLSVALAFASLIFCGAAFDYSVVKNLSESTNFQWLSFDVINFYLGTYLDKTSAFFLLCTGTICFLIQNVAYFKLGDREDFPRLLFYLNLFTFGLNGIFISPNLFQSYVFCEITGVASYLLINFDFSNREQSKAGIKSFIYNRIGDLTLFFCVLTVMYYAVTYNSLFDTNALAYANMNNLATCINSLMSPSLFIFFCSVLIFVIIMKFMHAFIYIVFESKEKGALARIVLYQNSLIALVGLFFFIRFNPFFFSLAEQWIWTPPVIILLFVTLGILNRFFIPICKIFGWIEKYIVETVINITELVIRGLSYLSGKLQGGNFQSYLIYSLFGLISISAFVLIFYILLIKG